MTAPSLTLDALTTVCATSQLRPHLAAPFTVEIEGAPWTVATDGIRLLAVRYDYGASLAFPGLPENVQRFHAEATDPSAQPLGLALLRAFFAAHAPAPLGTCPECNGNASEDCDECDGGGEIDCECIDCGNTHQRECKACGGRGSFVCARCKDRDVPVYVKLGASIYDAQLAASLFAVLPSGEARFRQPAAPLPTTLAGEDWFALLMPMRSDVGNRREMPTLALPVEPVAA